MKLYGSFFLFCYLLSSTLLAGESSALIEAEQMVVDKKAGFTLLEGHVSVLVRAKKISLKARKLKINRDSLSRKIIKARADFEVVVEVKGEIFKGDHIYYDRLQSLLELKGNIYLQLKKGTVTAEHLLYNLKSEKGKITAKKSEAIKIQIYATQKNGRETKFKMQAGELLIDKKTGKLVLLQNVQVKDLEQDLILNTNRATLFFNQVEEIEEIIAEGNFSLKQPGRYSLADRAHFDYKTDKIVLSGAVTVKNRDQIELHSSRVEMFLDVAKGFISGGDKRPLQLKIPLPNQQ
jgi:lipopolysaccharide transport protein LptA